MRPLRLVLAGVVTAALLGSSGAAVGQDGNDAGFTPVTGQRLTAEFDDTAVEAWEDQGLPFMSGFVSRETWEWSDPRLPTDATWYIATADYQPTDGWPGEVIYQTVLMDDEDGYWTGTGHLYADEMSVGHGMVVLDGHGAYEGHFAFLMGHTDDPDCTKCETFTGAIYRGAPPPMPEIVEPAAD